MIKLFRKLFIKIYIHHMLDEYSNYLERDIEEKEFIEHMLLFYTNKKNNGWI